MKNVGNGWGNPENRDVEFPDEIVMDSRENRKLGEHRWMKLRMGEALRLEIDGSATGVSRKARPEEFGKRSPELFVVGLRNR
ncbi:MAG: hypothetical protein RLZZ232_1319 [Planctomycetota bacterium]|jgi:hypothetical protein